MSDAFYAWLCGLIKAGNVHPFYTSAAWTKVAQEVRRLDHNECRICRAHGRYRRAQIVHHEMHLRKHPRLALDIWYTDAAGEKRRNLICVCKRCHEEVCHPERLRKFRPRREALTVERWD